MALSGSADAARTVAVTRGILDEGPVFVGEGVAWSELDCLTGCDSEETSAGTTEWSVVLADAGRRPAILASRRLTYSGQGTPNSSGAHMSFDASPTRLVLLRISESSDEFFGDSEGLSVRAGSQRGRLRQLLSCGAGAGANVPFSFDLDGDLLAYDSAPCNERVERPVVRALGVGTVVALPLAPGRAIARFVVAGDYVAVATAPASGAWPDEATVHDARSGRLLYAVALPADEVLHGIDMGSDGTLAVVSSSAMNDPPSVFCATSSLRLYTPARPSGRRLEVRPCSALVELAGTRVLYTAGAGHRSTLTAVDAQDERQRILRFGNVRLGGVDAEERRIAYVVRLCSGHGRIMVQRLDEPVVSAGSPRCPVSLPARRLLASRSGRLRVPVRCPRGCDGFLYVSPLSRSRSYLDLLEKSFRLPPGRRYVGARLRHVGRRLLRSRGRLRVQVSAAVYDRAFDYRVVNRRALLLHR
jgi:hypothetical protein